MQEDRSFWEKSEGDTTVAAESPVPTADAAEAAAAPENMNWYIIHTYSGFEQKVAESLRSRAEAFGMMQGLGWCDRFLEGEHRERLRTFVRRLVAPAMDRLGWEADADEPDRIRALRGALLQGLGVLGADPNAEAAAREFEAEARAGKPVDASLAAAAVNVVAFNGDATDYDHFWTAYRESPTPQEQYRYLFALPLFRDPALLDRTLEATFGDDIRSQDAPFLFAYAVTNRDLGDRAWVTLRERWADTQEHFPSQLTIRLADGARYLTKPEQVAEAEAFFAEHPIPQSAKMLEQVLERQRVAAALRQRATPDLEAYFSD